LIVSHDRAFLAATCSYTLDLSRGKLTMFPGKIDAFLEFQADRREHDERTNVAVLAKRKQLEEFIAKNKARASTATRARSKSKQLEKLETVDIDNDEPAKLRRLRPRLPHAGKRIAGLRRRLVHRRLRRTVHQLRRHLPRPRQRPEELRRVRHGVRPGQRLRSGRMQ
jgi:ATP-binding cassette subfamily F protein 3